MLIGVCTTDFNAMPLDMLFKKIYDLGFEAVQFSFSSIIESDYIPSSQLELPDFNNINIDLLEKIRHASEKYNLPIAAVNGTFNMAHPDKYIRNEGIARFKKLSDAVALLGCKIISLCSGTRNASHLWSPHVDNNMPAAWSDMLDTFEKILPFVEKHNITLAVETEAANIIDTPEKARKLMDYFQTPYLKMIMDCANLFHIGKSHRENVFATISQAFDVFGDDVVLAHGKDISDSSGINFCATGEGIIDYNLFFEQLRKHNFNGTMAIHGVYDESKLPNALKIVRKAYNSIY